MYSFSNISISRLASCDEKLQRLFAEVIKHQDCSILVGHRCQADQDLACAAGKSHTPWPTSKHNRQPSRAVDVAPFPIDWDDIARFTEFAALVKACAATLGIDVRWGGDFTTLQDYDHWELVDG